MGLGVLVRYSSTPSAALDEGKLQFQIIRVGAGEGGRSFHENSLSH
jgi:hypothetical protein